MEKQRFKTENLTIRGRIIYLLHLHAGEFLSVAEIQNKYFEKHKKKVNRATVLLAIDENNFINSNIEIEIQRRFKNKQPVTVYGIQSQI